MSAGKTGAPSTFAEGLAVSDGKRTAADDRGGLLVWGRLCSAPQPRDKDAVNGAFSLEIEPEAEQFKSILPEKLQLVVAPQPRSVGTDPATAVTFDNAQAIWRQADHQISIVYHRGADEGSQVTRMAPGFVRFEQDLPAA